MNNSLSFWRAVQQARWCVLTWFLFASAIGSQCQTVYLDFNSAGEFNTNFNEWNDNGSGGNGGNYSLEENTTAGAGGTGGVAINQNNDTTATYITGSWDLSTNGATIVVSALIHAYGPNSGTRFQIGVANGNANGLNNNTGVAFESFRLTPISETEWAVVEQYRTSNKTVNPGTLGTVSSTPGHWYKFEVSITNTSGASGNLAAGCALYDYGADGLTPGANLITFPTSTSHDAQQIATNSAVWPALHVLDDSGSVWDNFLVCPATNLPVLSPMLTNVNAIVDTTPVFSVQAYAPGAITFAWYTNHVLVPGATTATYTPPPLPPGFTNIAVVVANANGSVTNQATVTVFTPMSPLALTGFNRDLVIESNAIGPPYSSYAVEFQPGQELCYYQQGLRQTSYGLPASGVLNGELDEAQFQFQPYTSNNAFLFSGDTGLHSGTLTLVNPAVYARIGILANSAGASATTEGLVTLHFSDGSTYLGHYNAADWFSGAPAEWQGVDAINLASGATQGGPANPGFFETTINISELAANGKTLTAVSFVEPTGVSATAIYAISGLLSGANPITLATMTNFPATQVQTNSAILGAGVVSTGGYVPTATIFYGPSDGGRSPAAWANSIPFGFESGDFSQMVTNLEPGVIYYVSVQASNIAGLSWARPPQIFSTPSNSAASFQPPRVTNFPAANITANTATLAADVLATGSLTPVVTIFYGPIDGGTNASQWASSISLGLESSYASVTIPGLASNTTYYFTSQASNSQGVGWSSPSFSFTTLATNPPSTLVPMLTYHNDNTRDGVNTNEILLTPANVNTNTFGKLFGHAVDGYVYAQPLVMTNVVIPGKGLHNVVIVATENDSVYAFDADSDEGPNAEPLWQTSFLDAANGITTVPTANVGNNNIQPVIGITDTPVIDPATGTIYVEAKTMQTQGASTQYFHRLHALDITTGAERVNGVVSNSPALIAATNYPGTGYGDSDGNGHVPWNPLRSECRPGLTLLNGVIYVAYASHGDVDYYHGWLFSYSARSLAQLSVYNTTPNGGRGGIWQGGGGATVDEQGNFYFVTGNGNGANDFNATGTTFSQSANNFAMSALKFRPTNGVPTLVDFFTPFDQASQTAGDSDLNSGAPLVLPDSAGSAAHPHLMTVAGKNGKMYVVDRDNMGHFNASSDSQIVQVLTNVLPGGSFSTPAFYNGRIYFAGSMNSRLLAFSVTNAQISTAPVSQTATIYGTTVDGLPGAPVITANGLSNAIVWEMQNDGYMSGAPGVLHAYNATNLAQELYNSSLLPERDAPGSAIQFTGPTVVNGKAYVGTLYNLTVYGLGSFLPTPIIQPNGGYFTNEVTVSFSDSKAGANFHYTVDGTLPTTNSLLYSGAFTLTNSVTVQVIASAQGAVSGVASASFVNTAAGGSGLGLVGSYYSNQLGTFIAPATLVRTDPDINFNWGGAAPDPSISPTNFCVRWTGCVQPQYSENYTFYTLTDAGARLYVNGQLLIDAFSNQPPTQWTATTPMVAQQIYNIQMDYFYQNTGDSVAQLSWSSPSTPFEIIPQSQLYPITNPAPVINLTSPTNAATLTAAATLTLVAEAAAQSNAVAQVAFYTNGQWVGTVTNLPYALTATGLPAGSYTLTAVASDTTGLSATSAPVVITVNTGTGLPYGLTNYPVAPPFYNMPTVFSGPLPAQLSLTGVFSNTPGMAPVATLIPYAPNVPLWSDSALKVRYMSVPNSGLPFNPGEQIAYAPTFTWAFPSGTVFVKTFELLTNESDPTSLRRLETRLLVRDTNGAVYGITYKWRPDNSDADLLTNSLTEAVPVQTPSGLTTNLWYYPSPSDCLQCHTAVANYVLGVNARQLNGTITYSNGVADNQLRVLNRIGLLYPAIDESQITNIEQLSSLTNLSASFQQRARSYLDANCAQCHVQPNGPGPTFDARYDVPLANQKMIGVAAVKGNLGYDNVDIVTPEDVWRSSIYDRMNTLNTAIQMPPLARNLIDTNAVQVMAGWINSLHGTPALPPPVLTPAGGIFQGYVSVSLQDPGDNVTMYYTLDGSVPTTNSTPYMGPIMLTNSAPLNANAWAEDYINSVVGAAQFTILPGLYFTSPGGFTNGTFQMGLSGWAGSNYVLQVSTNLAQWTSLSTNTPATSNFILADPTAPGGSARFYRVLRVP